MNEAYTLSLSLSVSFSHNKQEQNYIFYIFYDFCL